MSTKPVVNGKSKPAAKAAAPAPLKIKVGQGVKVKNTRNGGITTGRFVGREKVPGAAGDWLKYNVAPKGKPAEYKLARAGQVSV